MSVGTSHTRANLHGRPLKLAKELAELTEHRGKGFPSIRAWGRHVREIICALAQTNVEPRHFSGYVGEWVVGAIIRQRGIDFRVTQGVR